MRSPTRRAHLSVEALDDRMLPSGLFAGLNATLGALGGLTASVGVQLHLGGSGQAPTSPPTSPPPAAVPASLSGHVFYDDGSGTLHPLSGVKISLFDSAGEVVAEATTDAAGAYSFGDLAPGTYTIAQGAIPYSFSYTDGAEQVGTVNGQPRGQSNANDQFTVTLAAGESGVGYDFTEHLAG